MRVTATRALPLTVLLVIGVVSFGFWAREDAAESGIVDPMDQPPALLSADRDTADEQARARVGGFVDDVTNKVSHLTERQQELESINADLEAEVKDLSDQLAKRSDALGERGRALMERLESRLNTFRDDLNRVVNRQAKLGRSAPDESSRPQGDPYAITWIYPEDYAFDPNLTGSPGNMPGNPLSELSGIRSGPRTRQYSSQTAALEQDSPLNASLSHRATPKYTLHDGMQLTGAVLETSLIGKIPFDGAIQDAFSFTGLIGKENLAAMGQRLPEVKGIRFRGTAIGQWGLSCVKANVESMTFLFEDGTISTTRAPEGKALGILSNRFGRTCLPGIKVGNLREYITDRFLVGTVGAAGDAAAAAASTRTFSTESGVASQVVTGETGEFIAGRALGRGMEDVADLLDRLTDDAVAAVYVDNGAEVSLLLEQQINIDYNPEGRKLRHGSLNDASISPRLD